MVPRRRTRRIHTQHRHNIVLFSLPAPVRPSTAHSFSPQTLRVALASLLLLEPAPLVLRTIRIDVIGPTLRSDGGGVLAGYEGGVTAGSRAGV